MTMPKRIAFFAPIKPPDHHIPSGDRLIAQNLLKALDLGGHKVELASRYICYSKRSGLDILEERKQGALQEAARLVEDYLARPTSERPQVWITYHPYCKAPDWIGPIVSSALSIPYLTIEAARTGQGGPQDEWGPWRVEAQAGLRKADLHIVFKPTDRDYLAGLLGSIDNVRNLSPFVDMESLTTVHQVELPATLAGNGPVLITAGMMRKGKKDRNFYMLAEILEGMQDLEWGLVVIGGGPEEGNIRAAYAGIEPSRIHWTGQVEHREVIAWMRACDIFIWPGWKEPIGMVYLEAQSQGLPVVAYESMGVPIVVRDGETGILAPEDDLIGIRDATRTIINDDELRDRMSKAGPAKVAGEHSIEAASQRLSEILSELGQAE